jgi:hypothetical protein
MKRSLSISTIALSLIMGVTGVHAQSWTSAYTSPTATGDCAGLQDTLTAGFTTTKIVSQALFGSVAPIRVLKMAFWKQAGSQYTDIYMVEKGSASGTTARILYFNGATSALSVIGTLPNVNFGGNGVAEDGLLGIAVNPVMHGSDNYIYLYYSVGTASGTPSWTNGWRISRFSIDPTTKAVNLASEKVLLTVPASHNARWHTAGALQFDNFGNLYIGTGDNEALAMGAGNTADMRGAVLRIKPDDSPRGYSIPAGNFGAYWGQKWEDSGLVARAAEYRDTSKVKAELYVKGSRNPYTLSLDKYRLGWLQWSECGPDAQRGEEHNFTTKPAFSGWPFWAGNAVKQTAKAGSYGESPDVGSGTEWTAFNYTAMTTQVPINNYSGNPGVDTLPPMHVPAHAYASPTCAAGGGPIIRYDGRLATGNPTQMPPHLDNVAMYSDFTSTGVNTIWAKKIDTLTGAVTGTVKQALKMPRSGRPNLSNPVDFQQGPDGNLYMIDWGTGCCSENSNASNNGIVRISYTGTCQDPGLNPGTVALDRQVLRGSVDWLRVGSNSIRVSADGRHTVQILDVTGRVVNTFSGTGESTYKMPALAAGQIYVLRVTTPVGTAVRTLSHL